MTLESAPIAVLGAGTMGTGIAEIGALAGHHVLLADADAGAPITAIDEIATRQRSRAERGKIDRERAEGAIACLTAAEPCDVAGCGLIVEAISEDARTKIDLLSDIEQRVGDDAILASNTSSLSITSIAAGLRRPDRVAGLHFFNPVPVMRLVEVVSGMETDTAVADRLAELMYTWGKVPVRCSSTPGFIVNRVARPFYNEAFRAVSEDLAAPGVLDQLLTEGGGFRMGPLELSDLIGQDVNQSANRAVWAGFDYDPWFRPSSYQDQLVMAGRLGCKTGHGVYDYTSGHGGNPSFTTGSVQPAATPSAFRAVAMDGELCAPEKLTDPALVQLVAQLTDGGIRVSTEPALAAQALRLRGSNAADALIVVTDGRAAADRAAEIAAVADTDGGRPSDAELLLLDIVPGVAERRAVGLTSSAGPDSTALRLFTRMLNTAGIAGLLCADVPGLLLVRTLAMLINLAVDAAAAGVATRADIATAMQLGVRYPRNLYTWGDELGVDRLVTVLDHLEDGHSDGHFRPCAALRRAARTGETLAG